MSPFSFPACVLQTRKLWPTQVVGPKGPLPSYFSVASVSFRSPSQGGERKQKSKRQEERNSRRRKRKKLGRREIAKPPSPPRSGNRPISSLVLAFLKFSHSFVLRRGLIRSFFWGERSGLIYAMQMMQAVLVTFDSHKTTGDNRTT